MATNDIEMLISWQDDREKQEHICKFRRADGTIETIVLKYDDIIKHFTEEYAMENKEEKLGPTGVYGHPDPKGERPKERGAILDEAKKIINGIRNDMYGKPEDNFELIAKLWSLYLQKRYRKPDSFVGYLSPQDVALMMAYMKMARITSGRDIKDSFVDCAGYLGIAADMGTIAEEAIKKLEESYND